MIFGKEGARHYLLEAQLFPLIFTHQILPVQGVATLNILSRTHAHTHTRKFNL